MKREYKYKYVIDVENRVVVALSTFAGETVRGVARCAPNDAFNIEAGKKIAEARCSAKIAHKRLKRAEELKIMASYGAKYYNELLDTYTRYETDALAKVAEAVKNLKEIEESFN